MSKASMLRKFFIAITFMFCAIIGKAQILTYTTDTSGALSSVATFASGTSLSRVNGAVEPAGICSSGFSTTNFTSTTTYSTTLPAVQVSATPSAGYALNVTGFSVDIRRSNTGPVSVRYAYSTDGGTTWIDQGVDQAPNYGSCGVTVTATWSLLFTVNAPSTLLFRVYGFNASGTGGTFQIMNLIINGTVVATTGCTVPTGLSVTGLTTTAATLNWTAVPGALSYNIQYRPVGSSTWTSTTSTTTSINISGLTCATNYEYQVETVCSSGTSGFSPSSTFVTSACPGCPMPTSLFASSVTLSSATLNWHSAIGAAGYVAQYRQTGTTTWTTTSTIDTFWNITGLSCGTTYEFQVQTVCSGSSTSAFTASTTFTTITCACPAPVGLSVTGVTTSAGTLNWTAATGALSYNIQYRQYGTTTWSSTTSSTNSVGLTSLACGTTYEFQVQSVCSITSSSAWSASDTFSTSACLCPYPTGLSATAITTTTATLSWTSVVWAVSYYVHYRPVGTSTWITDSTTATSVAITGLTCGTTYEFQVETVCGGLGTGSYSPSVTFTTASCVTGGSSGKINIYFNQPVDNTVSSGVNAVYLNSCMADTIIAYINRAKYSIDIAQYDYNQSSGFANIATAVNNAYLAGKKVRWIYDGSQSNTGLALLNSGIHTLASPTTSAYGIMHNKFVLIDANSTDANDAIVNTGSEDWGVTQFNYCYNNTVFIQDSAMAHVFKQEFDMMWGDTGVVPNPVLSKFGPYKTDLGRHTFSIGGKTVELYFSPSDGTDSHIQSSINSANTDLYFGVYTFTEVTDANDIVAKYTGGVYTAGIVDQYSSTTGSAYPILTSGLGTNLKTYTGSYIYHNKMLIVDPSNFCSDPLVLTGSHNWTTSANTLNDENVIIIHNDTVANIYYQSFVANYASLGGTVTPIANCSTLHTNSPALEIMNDGNSLLVYPNPVEQSTNISYNLSTDQTISLGIYNIVGQEVMPIITNKLQQAGDYNYSVNTLTPGIYFVKFTVGQMTYTKKIVKL